MNELVLFLTSLSVIGALSFALARLTKAPMGATLLPALSSVVLFQYAAASFGVLRWAPWILIGLATLAAAVAWGWGARRPTEAVVVDPAAVLAAIAGGVCWFRLTGERYLYWDEFNHWGLVSKTVHVLGRLPRPGDAVELLDYPPGTALFHVFVTQLGGFTEGHTYAAQALLVICAWASIVHRLRWSQVVLAVIGFLCAYALGFTLTAGIASLYADLVVAAVFGGTLAVALAPPGSLLRQAGLLAPSIAVLPLLKEVGWPLAQLVSAVAAATYVMSHVASPANGGLRSWPRGVRVLTVGGVLLCLLMGGAYATRATWQRHLTASGVPRTFVMTKGLRDLPAAFAENATPREQTTVARFRDALFTAPVIDINRLPFIEATWRRVMYGSIGTLEAWHGRSTVFWIALLVGMGLAAAACQPTRLDAARNLVVTLVLSAGVVLYLAGHLLAYLYAFSEFEGTRLASFGRYVGLYVLGWSYATLAAVVFAASAPGQSWPRRVVGWSLLVACVLGCARVAPYDATAFVVDGVRPLGAERAAIDEPLRRLTPVLRASDRVYIVFQGSLGLEHRIARLEVAPSVANISCWSLGAWYRTPDPWTCEYPAERVALMWQGYSVLFLGMVDAKFWAQYGELFPQGSERHRVFRLSANVGGLRIVPLD